MFIKTHKGGHWLATLGVSLASVAWAGVASAAQCTYTVTNEWGSGFQAAIKIDNNTTMPINDWRVSWQYNNGNQRDNGWNANVAGSNPYTATPLSWNSNIAPGQSIEFGVQGSTGPSGIAEVPVILGDVCTTGTSSSMSPPSSSSVSSVASSVLSSIPASSSTPSSSSSSVSVSSSSTVSSAATSSSSISGTCDLPYSNNGTSISNQSTTWSSGIINIACNGNVNLSMLARGAGPMEPSDFLNIYYKIDDGPAITLSPNINAFAQKVVSINGLRGNTLEVIVEGKTSFSDEIYTVSNITINSNGASSSAQSSTTSSAGSSSSSGPLGAGVFRVDTSGNITKDGVIKPIHCANWFGLEGRHEPSDEPTNPGGAPMELYVGNMIWNPTGRTIQQTLSEITGMGLNTLRIPIAPQTLDPTNPQGLAPNLKNHTSVLVSNSRQALEELIIAADQNNVDVFIDIHSCSNYVGWRAGRLDARPPYVDSIRKQYDYFREDSSCAGTGNPAGVTRIQAYDKDAWLANLREIAALPAQLGVSNIIGIDVYNEPWDYSWAEWKSLVESAYTAINEVNPNLLVFVEGISGSSGNQDGTPETKEQTPHGDLASNPNWGENFFEMGANPLNIPKERLVLSPHTYGPSVFQQAMFMDPSQPECEGLEGEEAGQLGCNLVIDPARLIPGWDEHFGYLRSQGYAMVVGEFGGNWDWPTNASAGDRETWSHITPGIVDGQWQAAFVDYMISKNIQGCYWGMNPESGDTGGWYGHNYDPISNTEGWGTWQPFDARKTNLLNRLWGK